MLLLTKKFAKNTIHCIIYRKMLLYSKKLVEQWDRLVKKP